MRRNGGLTLIEMILTIAVGSILMVGLGVAAKSQVDAGIDNRNTLIALNLAKWQMAKTSNAAYPAVAAEAAQTADPAFPDFIPTLEVVSVATNGGNSIREIRVRVRWGSVSGPVLVALYTYRTDILTFGTGT